MSQFKHLVDLEQPWFWAAIGSVVFNPVFWNIVARNGEPRTFQLLRLLLLPSDAIPTSTRAIRIPKQDPYQSVRITLQRHLFPCFCDLFAWNFP